MRLPRALFVLLLLGVADLVSTLWWYSNGLMSEMNPIMRPLLETSMPLFAALKLSTLLAFYVAIARYVSHNPSFCRQACTMACAAYAFLWCGWVAAGNLF